MISKIINFILSLFKKETNIEIKQPEIKIPEKKMLYEKLNGTIIFNCSAGKANYSQRNNEFKWVHPKNSNLKMDALSMCNVTSMAMALDYLGYQFPSGKFTQPEDNLCDFMFTDPSVDEYYKKVMPAMWAAWDRGDNNAFAPNLIHAVLAFATNKWLGCTSAVTFKEAAPINTILEEVVLHNRPVVMSGTWPFTYASGTVGTIGHINVLVGAVYNEKDVDLTKLTMPLANPIELLVDDPYGDYKDNFKSTSNRNDIINSWGDFIKYYKPLNDPRVKFAHIFKNAAATI
jgi:hypothetical protein